MAEREGNVTRKLQDPNTILLLASVLLFLVVHAVDYLVRPIPPMCIVPASLSGLLDSKHQRLFQNACVCVGDSLSALVSIITYGMMCPFPLSHFDVIN